MEFEIKYKEFVFTGSLNGVTRKKATQIIEHCGGRVKGGMSGFVDYLIVGDKPGIKLQKAKYHPFVRIIPQKEFFKDSRISEFLSNEELDSI